MNTSNHVCSQGKANEKHQHIKLEIYIKLTNDELPK